MNVRWASSSVRTHPYLRVSLERSLDVRRSRGDCHRFKPLRSTVPSIAQITCGDLSIEVVRVTVAAREPLIMHCIVSIRTKIAVPRQGHRRQLESYPTNLRETDPGLKIQQGVLGGRLPERRRRHELRKQGVALQMGETGNRPLTFSLGKRNGAQRPRKLCEPAVHPLSSRPSSITSLPQRLEADSTQHRAELERV